MINVQEINETIEELEQAPTSYPNCQRLACLYTVRDHLIPQEESEKINPVISEYQDILPGYQKYCETKKQFQLKEVAAEKVITDLKSVTKEIKEFIDTLYTSTDMPQEREIIEDMIESLHY